MNDDNDQFDTGGYPREKQPWFGPRRFGYGTAPRTWQGFLITAILVVYVVVVATLTKGRMPDMLFAVIPAIAVPLVIRSIQRR